MTTIEFSHRLLDLRDQLYRFANQLTKNSEDAKDLLQETYFKAIKSKDSFEENTNLGAWTYTIMKNTFINAYRKTSRYNTIFDNKNDMYALSPNVHSAGESSYLQQEEISKTIHRLNEKFKIPFLLYFQGFSYTEIAQLQKLKMGTVKSRIFCARRKLRKELKEYAE